MLWRDLAAAVHQRAGQTAPCDSAPKPGWASLAPPLCTCLDCSATRSSVLTFILNTTGSQLTAVQLYLAFLQADENCSGESRAGAAPLNGKDELAQV